MMRCILRNLPSFLWGETMSITIYTLNRYPMKLVEGKNLYEAWMGKKPNISQVNIFGRDVYAFIIFEKRTKLDKRSKKCIFLVYKNQHRGYRLYSPSFISMFILMDAKFNELFEESTSNEKLDDFDESSVAPN